MATDNRSIVITLKLDQGSETVATSEQTDTSATAKKNDKDSAAKSAYAAMAVQVIQTSVSEVVSWADYFHSKGLIANDDYISQREKNIALTQINRATSYLATIGTFTALGAKAGPWGAAIGAVLGTGIAVAQIARSNVQGQQQQDIQLRQMNAQLSYTRSRAGWSLRAASIGEDL